MPFLIIKISQIFVTIILALNIVVVYLPLRRRPTFVSSWCIHPLNSRHPDIQSYSPLTDFCHKLKTTCLHQRWFHGALFIVRNALVKTDLGLTNTGPSPASFFTSILKNHVKRTSKSFNTHFYSLETGRKKDNKVIIHAKNLLYSN